MLEELWAETFVHPGGRGGVWEGLCTALLYSERVGATLQPWESHRRLRKAHLGRKEGLFGSGAAKCERAAIRAEEMGYVAVPERDVPRDKRGVTRLCCSSTIFPRMHLPSRALLPQICFRLLEEEHSKQRGCSWFPKQSPVLPQLANTMARVNPTTQSAEGRNLHSPAKNPFRLWRRDLRRLHLPAGPGGGRCSHHQ